MIDWNGLGINSWLYLGTPLITTTRPVFVKCFNISYVRFILVSKPHLHRTVPQQKRASLSAEGQQLPQFHRGSDIREAWKRLHLENTHDGLDARNIFPWMVSVKTKVFKRHLCLWKPPFHLLFFFRIYSSHLLRQPRRLLWACLNFET